LKILIAEDDGVSRRILQKAIDKFGHECLEVADGEQAWEIYAETPDLDVIVSDWMMPGMDGVELCRRVRQEPHPGGYTFFIFLTALSNKEHLMEGMEVGADDYLTKPLDREELEVRLISAQRVTSLQRRIVCQKEELEDLNAKLARQSREDPLTGLGNRLRMNEDLANLHARFERYGHHYCVILCDIDYFKGYNDRYGHLAGDEALKKVAEDLRHSFRMSDTFYRYGGEEFLVVLPDQDPQNALTAADRLLQRVRDLGIEYEGSPTGVLTLSAGVASVSPVDSSASFDGLLARADYALYRAKEEGRDRVALYEG
jgi:diguanylate cyclase (GGDEF)-like protein